VDGRKPVSVGRRKLSTFLLALLCLPVPFSLGGEAAEGAARVLVLTDGSRERVRGYSIEGGRLRYYSAERNEWEEMPAELVDWPATERQARREADAAAERSAAAGESARRQRQEDLARAPQVAPGMRLPAPGRVYLVDRYGGAPVLVLLDQSGGRLNKNMKGNILRGILNPVAGSRQMIELEGPRADVRSHTTVPEIYFPVEPGNGAPRGDGALPGDSEGAAGRLRLVSCEERKGNRVVFSYNIAVYGRMSVRAQYVETIVEPVSDYWVKVTPAAPVEPGEYALVEFDREGAPNELVWDFAVDPLAGANPAIRPGEVDRGAPVLILRGTAPPPDEGKAP